MPGRLSVARTFGDAEAKIKALNGNPKVIIHNPEVRSFQIQKEHDFIILGCDGIFDKLSDIDVIACAWRAVYDNQNHPTVKGKVKDIHKMCGSGVEYILKNSLLRRSLDNVTIVIIAFNNFKHSVFGKSQQPTSKQASNDTVDKIKELEKTKVIERTKSANLPKYHPEKQPD